MQPSVIISSIPAARPSLQKDHSGLQEPNERTAEWVSDGGRGDKRKQVSDPFPLLIYSCGKMKNNFTPLLFFIPSPPTTHIPFVPHGWVMCSWKQSFQGQKGLQENSMFPAQSSKTLLIIFALFCV